ncbi:murein L,D-transpeptidase catalytic domain family protein [Bdellovibrio svalbardensis]|uniref:Murein L,D-transpeptidase catalytic domain family protein n=1 Tax=Bdellovibrio svalbardensis TaxID=2972972 RepID=A0ABT6DFW9_9BACT|nr:murein L,D-transpeptidase catalytic domain family protein [Bdellovibrio svalbardensis]MDG0815745.1 murein L,D-transpeptidase catalytic domain family protein [Bdellovibrio svalbardensis]
MKNKFKMLSILTVIFFNTHAFAEGLADKKINGERLYDLFKKQGVPEQALQRSLEFMDTNGGKTIKVKTKVRPKEGDAYLTDRSIDIKSDYIAIIDFSEPSDSRRLLILDLQKGTVSKHFVAHGKGSGVRIATKFSNLDGSKMSSLGFYLGGSTYFGGHGESLNLYGLEKSNDQAAARDIVVHAANYVSPEFVASSGRLGRSWGCPAVAPGIIKKMITLFKDGGVIYAYQKDLMSKIQDTPTLQEIHDQPDEADVDLPNEEEDFQKK